MADADGHGGSGDGPVRPFLPPSERQQDTRGLPYEHAVRQTATYETEPGDFSALCPFSSLPDAALSYPASS